MSEVMNKLRGLIRRVTVKNIKDGGQMQTASAEVAEGIWRDDVEIWHPYGLLSVPDEDGALGISLSIGGDEGDMALLALSNPSQRMGGLLKGDVGLANKHGDRVLVRASGGVEIKAANSFTAKIGGVTFTVTSAGVDINGGYLKNNGVDVGSTHKHGGVVEGTDESDVPIG